MGRFGDWHKRDRLGSQGLAGQPPDRSGAGVAVGLSRFRVRG
jgi:hypothetical protein